MQKVWHQDKKSGHPKWFSGVGTILNYYNGLFNYKQILDYLSGIEIYTVHTSRLGMQNQMASLKKK